MKLIETHFDAVCFGMLLGAASLRLLGCAAVNREVAKDQYTLDLQGCIDHNTGRAAQDSCIKAVQATWTEAGSPPAAKLDGGHE